MATEPKYDEDVVNLGYLKKIVADPEGNIENIYENVSKHYASKPQPPYHKGDTWIDGNIIYTCINDREIGTYQDSDWTTESGARQEAEKKNKVFLRQPSNYNVGDMWILQSDEDHKAGKRGEILISTAGRKEYNENDWVNMLGYGTIASINEVANNLNDAIERIGVTEEAIADGLIVTFYQATIPEGKHIGDLWYVTETVDEYIKGKLYRYNGEKWEILKDPEITQAFEEANEARIVADGKIQSFYTATAPLENVGVGDLWIDTDDNNKLYRHNGTNWVAVYDTRIDTIQKEVETVTETTVEIQTDLGQINNRVNTVETTITTLGQIEKAEGQELVVDASNNPAKLYCYGNTFQETSKQGNNILGLPNGYKNTIGGITVSIEDGVIIVNGSTTNIVTFDIPINPIKLKGNYIYSVSGEGASASSTSFTMYNENNTAIGTFINCASDGSQGSRTLNNVDTTVSYIHFWAGANLTYDNTKIYYMVNEGTTVIPFEKFIPNMPSPYYTSDIRNVGDNIQLLNKDNWTNKYIINDGSQIGDMKHALFKDYIQIQPNTKNTLRANISLVTICFCFYDENKTFISRSYTNNNYTYSATSPSNAKYMLVFINYDNSTSIVQEVIDKLSLKLELSYGNINIKIEDEGNIFDTSKAIVCTIQNWWDTIIPNKTNNTSVTIDENYCLTGTASSYLVVVAPLRFIKGKTIYNKVNTSSIIVYDSDGKNIAVPSGSKYTPSKSFDGYIGIRINTGVVTDGMRISFTYYDVISYSPVQEQNIVFPMAEGQVLHKGDYLAEDGIHQVKGTLVLDGTENWQVSESNVNKQFYINGTNYKKYNDGGKCISSHYKYISPGTQNSIWIGNDYFVVISDTRFTTVDEFKSMLAEQYANGTPITIEYQLAEEIIIPYTPEQQKVLDSIETFKGINHIYCIDEIEPERMILTYYPNTPYNDTLVNKDTFDKVTTEMNAEFNIRANEVETTVREQTTASIMTLLNNNYLTGEQVNALVEGNAEDIATVKEQLTQTVTSSQMQIEITKAIEGGVSYLKNTLFTIDENGMWIATSEDAFNALYNNKGMYLYSYEEMIAKFDVDGTTIQGNLTLEGEFITPNLRMMNVDVSGVPHTHIHWIGG